ncbi:MAG: DEAD/DEAH box helicase [Betaproteobacteria bacterium]|nr:DEAD/DEAH box helicase [Betaproteobacteria bacterium]
MTPSRPASIFTVPDMVRWFTPRTIEKARNYGKQVRSLMVRDHRISAQVQGTAREPYWVEIEFFEEDGRLEIDASCSCPVGAQCKHCVAVLVASVAQRGQAAQGAPARSINPEVLEWAERTLKELKPAPAKKPRPAPQSTIQYVLLTGNPSLQGRLALLKGRIDDAGRASVAHWNNIERALVQPPQFVDEADLDIFRFLRRIAGKGEYWNDLPLHDAPAAQALARIVATGRTWLAEVGNTPYQPKFWRFTALQDGGARPARLEWRALDAGYIHAALTCDPPAGLTLGTEPPWYVDAANGQAGPLDCGGRDAVLRRLISLPPLSEADIPVVANLMAEIAPDLPPPDQEEAPPLVELAGPPRPVLDLNTLRTWGMNPHRGYPAVAYGEAFYDYATVRFWYGDARQAEVTLGDELHYLTLPDGRAAHIQRDEPEEKARMAELAGLGFAPTARRIFYGEPPSGMLGLESEAAWVRFFADLAPRLKDLGWVIAVPEGFRHYVLEADAWDAELEEQDGGWFSLSMGIVVEGQRLPLAPLLHDLFQREARWLDLGRLKQIADDAPVILNTPDGKRVRVPAGRIKPLAATLIDLFDAPPASGELRISALDAPRLAEFADTARWQFKGADAVARLAQRLKQSQGVQAIPAPPGFALELRPYQQEGLAWLQYLRAHELGGILADDMGLGKTAQALAHLLTEKQAGRLDRPALVVLPTSLIFNWKREAERCAPALSVLSLHGKDRFDAFAQIPQHDICLTTYPLLWRDEEELAKYEYASLILDEAQTVKNVQARAAAVVRKLKARHRLCLTGTPLENHLGELWAQFDFLLPGFLGDSKQFTKTWRSPIEKRGDQLRRDLLARRIAPFILRRKKQDVAKELPEKTVIVRTVELEGGQRDLYETVRVAMDARVRDEIASKGFSRSQIVILDALLKLRQVCCDPRLLKTVRAAEKVKERAKLDLLMDMLPELVEEGRRVLVFSQFTSMLDLIAAALDKAGIAYVTLTGQTTAREQVIGEFQEGDVPVFLISLKAGGVGLNLTAADTVIHYDPWWNPAVENQATDRAHRIGQKNKVFVYKLVVAGSIEERIVALQERKAALAEGVLCEDAGALAKFGEDDLRALLAPLPEK